MTQRNNIFLIAMLFVLSGCLGTFKHKLNFDPSEPLRVAIVPFAQVDSSGNVIEDTGTLLVDHVVLISDAPDKNPPQFVRKIVQSELQKSSLDLVSSLLIDIDMPHHGFAHPDGSLDLKKIQNVDPRELCTHFLNCDAVLFGKVFRWDRSYYAIQSVNSIGIELTLVSARDGKVLFSARAEDSESRGLTKGPTGFSDLVIEPIKGLDSDIIAELARKTIKDMLSPLRASSRPGFLNSSPPSLYGSAHDARSGRISPQSPLMVVLYGTNEQTASFSIGDVIRDIPMIERTPGHYSGEYYPLASDSFTAQTVRVSLTDQYGRKTVQEVGPGPVSLRAE